MGHGLIVLGVQRFAFFRIWKVWGNSSGLPFGKPLAEMRNEIDTERSAAALLSEVVIC